ncbi:MAG: hypothetical protein R3F13_14675 [Prosthecobacter sp.]
MYAYNEKDSTTKLKEGEAPGLEGNVPDRPVHVHHSSFLAGEDVAAAGEFVVGKNTVLRDKPLSPEKAAEQGVDANLAEVPVLKEVNNRSGHYMPGAEQAQQALDQFDREGVDLDNTKFTLHRSGKGPAVVEGMAKEFMQGRATPDELAKAAGDEDRTAKLKGAGEKTFVARHEVMEELKRGQPDLKRVDRPDLPDERSTDRETINFDDEVEFDLEEEEGITEDIGEKNRVPNTEVDKPAEKQAAGKLEAQSPGYDTDDEELSFQADGYGADDIDFDEVKKDVSNKAEVKEAAPQKQQAKPDSLASDAYEADDFDLDEVKKEVSNKAEVKESARQTPTVEESAQKAKMEAAKPQDPAADLNGAGKVSTAEALGLKKVGATQNQLNGPKAGDDLASVKSTAELAGLKKVGQASLDKAELEKIALSQKEGKVGDMIKLIDKNSNSQSGPKIR